MPKLIRITTAPMSLRYLLEGQMKYMSQNGFDVLMISADGKEVADLINREGCRMQTVPMTRAITPIQDLKCLWQLVKIFRKEKPDIVHTHTPKAGLLGMLAAKISRVPLRMHTIAGLPLMTATGFKRKLLVFIEKLTYWAADTVLPNSNSIWDFMVAEKMVRPSKLSMIGKGSSNGIDLNVFSEDCIEQKKLQSLKEELNYDSSRKYMLAVGRVVRDKGVIELVETFMKLSQEYPKLSLILLGPLEEFRKEELLPKNILEEIKQNKSIIHISWSDDVAYYMQLSDILVHASHREGFPNVMLQAGAMGLPMVCSRIPGNIDIVEHGKTGYVFEVGNTNELYDGVSWVLNTTDLALSQATTLRKIIEESFDRKVIQKQMLAHYKSRLGQ